MFIVRHIQGPSKWRTIIKLNYFCYFLTITIYKSQEHILSYKTIKTNYPIPFYSIIIPLFFNQRGQNEYQKGDIF